MRPFAALLYEFETMFTGEGKYGCISELGSLPVLLFTPNALEANASYTGSLGRALGRFTGCSWVSPVFLPEDAPVIPVMSCVRGVIKHQHIQYMCELCGSIPEQTEGAALAFGDVPDHIKTEIEALWERQNIQTAQIRAKVVSVQEGVYWMRIHLHPDVRDPNQYPFCSLTFHALYEMVTFLSSHQ